MARSCQSLNFSSSAGRPPGSTTFAFAIAFVQVDAGREDRSCLAKLYSQGANGDRGNGFSLFS